MSADLIAVAPSNRDMRHAIIATDYCYATNTSDCVEAALPNTTVQIYNQTANEGAYEITIYFYDRYENTKCNQVVKWKSTMKELFLRH